LTARIRGRSGELAPDRGDATHEAPTVDLELRLTGTAAADAGAARGATTGLP
jgi:hypothetical protein